MESSINSAIYPTMSSLHAPSLTVVYPPQVSSSVRRTSLISEMHGYHGVSLNIECCNKVQIACLTDDRNAEWYLEACLAPLCKCVM